jgi:ankyrin repeat protein
VSAYFALKLNNIEDVHNYSIECNDKRLRNFQDVVIHVTKNQTQVSFAILLKYKYADYKFRFSETFGKGVFSLKKYCELFKNLKDVDKQHQFILYTNAKFDPKWAAEVKNFTMIQDDRCDENMFLNTSSSRGNVYRFEVNDKTPQDEKITKSDYEMFFSRFRVFVCQKNVESFEKAMVKILQHNTLLLQYLHLFRKWHQHRFTNTTIDKTTVNIHLTDIFLSQFVTNRHLLVGQDEKLKFFEKVVKEFDITLISDCFENFAENLTEDSGVEEGVDESRKETNKGVPNTSLHQLISFAQKNKMIERSVTTLEPQIKLKVSQYLFQKPIIVHFNETSEELIYNLMKILQLGSKIKFIFVGQGIQSERLSRFRIFENLNDLRNNDELYSEVTRTCRLSLQGRKETTLEELIDSCEEISEHVGAKEILQMLKENFLIGQPADTLPSFYINRKVSFKVKTIDAFLDATFFNKHLAVVKLDKKAKEIQNEFRKRNINVVDVNDYLKSTQISNEPTIISTNEECSKQLLQLKSNNKTVVYLKISEDNGFLIISIEENQIRCLNRPVNILCADLGMGKTTMINKLRNEFDFSFWTIHVELRAHDKFFKTKHDANELLNHFIESNENNFSKHIRDVYLSKKKIYFFFDGLDEVEESCIENILYFIKTLSSKGFYVWIASRKNLKMQLEKHFELVAMDMEEVEEDQQKLYIENRLKKEYNHEQIENLLSKISNGSDVDNNCQVLGKAFQLYNITQIFLDDKKLLKQVTERSFIFTKMYEMFFRGRFKHNLDKAVPKNLHLSLAEEEDILEKHELLAVHCVFGEEIFKKLNLDLRLVRRFLNHIKWYKDPLDIVTKVNVEGKAVFKHFTYGEYFAARFFANNFAKARLIREELFSDRHKNLMMVLNVILAEDNPLHLAVIFRNVNKMEKYIQDKNIYDKAGRNPLHLATFNEPRCVDPKPCLIGVSIETREYYLTNICILKNMMKFNYADCDNLFEWSALQYAFENNSFVCVEMIQNTYEYSNKELHQHTKNVISNDNFYFFCLTHGCRNLLSSILEYSEQAKHFFKEKGSIIIEHTIKNCYFQENETLRFVIDTLQRKYDLKLDSRNKRGGTALHLAAMYEKIYAVKILLEIGASPNVLTVNNETPVDLTLDNRHGQIINLLTEKTPKQYLSIRKENMKRERLSTEKTTTLGGYQNNNEFQVHLTASRRNLKRVKLISDEGNFVDFTTPLHIAAFKGNVDIAELLINKGASVNALATNNETPLHWAADRGNSETVALLIEKGASVNALTTSNETPLHRAALSGNLETVALLIEKGASVNAITTDYQTPLHWVAQSGNLETVALLIEKGASVNAVATNNETPLHRATLSGTSETVALLIEKGASVNAVTTDYQTPLHLAAKRGNSTKTEILIEKGACVNVLGNETPLHLAALSGNSETVTLLIENGASVNALAIDNKTPVQWAADSENSETVALLIEKGTSVNALATDNKTPLHCAALSGNSETVALLIERGASVNALATNNQTPLHWAADSGNLETVALLIEKGASVNAVATSNETPLHRATLSGNSEIVALLIEKGASVNALATNNQTPLYWAADSGNSETVALLIEKGASVNALATGDDTPLHRAAVSGNSETVALLIEKGASVNARAAGNETPLYRAAINGNLETVALLIEKGASVNAHK